MKKHLIALVTIAMLFLTGCEASTNETSLPHEKLANQNSAIENSVAPNEMFEFSLLSADVKSNPIQMQSFIAEQTGIFVNPLRNAYYELVANDPTQEGLTCSIVFYDFENSESRVIKTLPYPPGSSYTLALSQDNNKLYLLLASLDETQINSIISMDRDGENEQELARLSENEMLIGALACDSSSLYTTIMQRDSGEYRLVKIDIASGNVTTLSEITGNGFLAGSFGNSLILQEYTGTEYCFYAIDATDGAKSLLYSVATGTKGLAGVVHTGIYYYVRPNDDNNMDIKRYDFTTGEEETLYAGLQYYDFDVVHIEGIYDEHLVIAVTDNTDAPENIKNKRYALELTGGILSELSLEYAYYNGVRAVEIIAEHDNYFFVRNEAYYETVSHTSNDGSTYKTQNPLFVYSLITKTDYWSNQPNYLPVQFK